MILSPHECVWLIDNVHTYSEQLRPGPANPWTGNDPVSGLPHRVVGGAVLLTESDTTIAHVDGADTEVMGRSADTTKDSFGQRDHGAAQISGYWWSELIQELVVEHGGDWRDPFDNVGLMRDVFNETARIRGDKNGWMAWQVYLLKPDGTRSFTKFLPDIKVAAARATWPPPKLQQIRIDISARLQLKEEQ